MQTFSFFFETLNTGPEIITSNGLHEIGQLICGTEGRWTQFFHPVSHNPWEIIISGPIHISSHMSQQGAPAECPQTRFLLMFH